MPASRRILSSFFLCAIFILLPSASRAQSPAEATAEFAGNIAGATGARRPVSLAVRNISSMGAAEFDRLRRSLESELRKRGLRLVSPDEEPEVQVTLSENIRGYLWVARIRIEDKEEVVMVPFPRPAEPVSASGESVRIEKKLLWKQAAPILDVGFLEDAQGKEAETSLVNAKVTGLVVLEPERVSLYSLAESGWRLAATFPIAGLPAPLPRDPRGKVQVEGTDFRVSMDRVECSGTSAEPPRLDCHAREEGVSTPLHVTAAWTVDARFVAGRNSFVISGQDSLEELSKLPPFDSLAAVPEGATTWWIVGGADGHTRLLYEDGSTAEELPGWGSLVAGVKSECGAGWQVLGTRGGDWTEPDGVQVFEIRDGQAVAVSTPAELPGPVTALWATETGAAATLVVYNLKSKNYEAYTLSFVCSR